MATKKLTPIKSIRAKCLDCCCGSSQEVKLCSALKCPIWAYRLGKRPITIPFERYTKKQALLPIKKAEDSLHNNPNKLCASVLDSSQTEEHETKNISASTSGDVQPYNVDSFRNQPARAEGSIEGVSTNGGSKDEPSSIQKIKEEGEDD